MNTADKNEVLIIDLEATCWQGPEKPSDQEQEIIEVGIVLYDIDTKEIIKSNSYLVRPQFSELSKFCTELTTLQPADFIGALTFPEVCKEIEKDFRLLQHSWSSWGKWDQWMMHQNCRLYGSDYPMSDDHLNIKELYYEVFSYPKKIGLNKALRKLGLKFEGTKHRGIDDAINTTYILRELFNKRNKIKGVPRYFWPRT